jgi:hypothetical protein
VSGECNHVSQSLITCHRVVSVIRYLVSLSTCLVSLAHVIVGFNHVSR